MKALKRSAALIAVLSAFAACDIAPGVDPTPEVPYKQQAGVADGLTKLGGVAGLNGFYQQISGLASGASGGQSYKYSHEDAEEFYTGSAEFKVAGSSIKDGTILVKVSAGVYKPVTLANALTDKYAFKGGWDALTKGTDYTTLSYNDGFNTHNLGDAELGAYHLYRLKNVEGFKWVSTQAGGTETWESKDHLGYTNNAVYYVKETTTNMNVIEVTIQADNTVKFKSDPREPHITVTNAFKKIK